MLPLVIIDYIFNYNYGEWFSKYVNDNKYLIVVEERDREQIWIGNRVIDVLIKDKQNNRIIAHFNTKIDNNGSPLEDDNYLLESNDEYILLKFFNYDGSVCSSYRFYFEDYLS